MPGTVDWRDPVTLRFRPSAPLTPNTSYTVTVADRFAAMDGSRLPRPYRFSFRVRGPRVLAGLPVGPNGGSRYLAADGRLDLVVDAPVDTAAVNAGAYLEFDRLCGTPGVVRLGVESQRAVAEGDPWEFREAGGLDRDRSADRLRRVVRLAPRRPLPHGCTGELVVPAAFDERGAASPRRWAFATYGDLRLTRASCNWTSGFCPAGPIVVAFSTPVRGAEVRRRLSLRPAVPFEIGDTAAERTEWALEAKLAPRTGYAVMVDRRITDVFGQTLAGNPVATAATTGFAPAINYASGRAVVERQALGTFALTYVNVDTLEVVTAPVPDSLEAEFLARSEWSWTDLWPALLPGARRQRLGVGHPRDRVQVYGVKLPVPDHRRPGTPTLFAVQVTGPRLDSLSRRHRPIALLQVTDLGVHAKVGAEEGVVWVTGTGDGQPRAGARVELRDAKGKLVASSVTDSAGLARLTGFRPPAAAGAAGAGEGDEGGSGFQGYVAVMLGDDRALLGINEYDPDLSPWRFNVCSAWGSRRLPVAAAVFTERGIYRPGEPLYAKAVVRTGLLGALARPDPGDSLRWVFESRADQSGERGSLRDTTVALSPFGTADQKFVVPAGSPLGEYRVVAQLRREGRWTEIAAAGYRVAEYRPPEFLVDVTADSGQRFAEDSVGAAVEARYLFGASMGRAAVRWSLRQTSAGWGEPEIPNTEGFSLSEGGWWYEELGDERPVQIAASGIDTLDASGRLALRLKLGATVRGRPSRATLETTVTDVNRQTVSAATSFIVHPADFYLGARAEGDSYFWTAGTPVASASSPCGPTDGG